MDIDENMISQMAEKDKNFRLEAPAETGGKKTEDPGFPGPSVWVCEDRIKVRKTLTW